MPPLIVSRATFAATGIAVRNVVNVGPPDEWSTFFNGLAQDVGILADSSEVRLTGGELAHADADSSVAVLSLDSSVYLDAVAISWSGWHAIGSYARAADVTLGLTDCTVEGATYGAIVAGDVGVRGRVVEVALQGGLFSGNRSGFGSDLYAEANSVVINGTWFEDSFGGYAPVYVKTSNLTLSGSIFQATAGTEAATVKSVGASSVVIVDALTVASPLASKALVWVEGPAASFSLGGAYIDFAAPIVVDARSSHVAEGVFLMGGGAPALVFRGGEAVVEHNRFCDGTGFSSLPSGLFVANGADLDVRENLVHGVPLTGTSLVSTVGVVDGSESGGGVIRVHDNTFVQVGSPTLFDLQATGVSIYNYLWRGPAPSIAQFDVSGVSAPADPPVRCRGRRTAQRFRVRITPEGVRPTCPLSWIWRSATDRDTPCSDMKLLTRSSASLRATAAASSGSAMGWAIRGRSMAIREAYLASKRPLRGAGANRRGAERGSLTPTGPASAQLRPPRPAPKPAPAHAHPGVGQTRVSRSGSRLPTAGGTGAGWAPCGSRR